MLLGRWLSGCRSFLTIVKQMTVRKFNIPEEKKRNITYKKYRKAVAMFNFCSIFAT